MRKISVVAIQHPEFPNLYLHGLRTKEKQWALPGGHANPGESPSETAQRELHEETGLQIKEMEETRNGEYYPREQDDGIQVTLFMAKCPSDLKLSTKNDPDAEFCEFKFLNPNTIENPYVPNERNILIEHMNRLGKNEDFVDIDADEYTLDSVTFKEVKSPLCKSNTKSFLLKIGEQQKLIFAKNHHEVAEVIKSEYLAKMPKIFSGSKKKPFMEVWRVQNKEGHGPYTSLDDLEWMDEHPEHGIEHSTETGRPPPSQDKGFEAQDLYNLNFQATSTKPKKFGFETKEQLSNWFSPTELENLKELGFKPTKIKATNVWSSGKQAFFEAYKKKLKLKKDEQFQGKYKILSPEESDQGKMLRATGAKLEAIIQLMEKRPDIDWEELLNQENSLEKSARDVPTKVGQLSKDGSMYAVRYGSIDPGHESSNMLVWVDIPERQKQIDNQLKEMMKYHAEKKTFGPSTDRFVKIINGVLSDPRRFVRPNVDKETPPRARHFLSWHNDRNGPVQIHLMKSGPRKGIFYMQAFRHGNTGSISPHIKEIDRWALTASEGPIKLKEHSGLFDIQEVRPLWEHFGDTPPKPELNKETETNPEQNQASESKQVSEQNPKQNQAFETSAPRRILIRNTKKT